MPVRWGVGMGWLGRRLQGDGEAQVTEATDEALGEFGRIANTSLLGRRGRPVRGPIPVT